MRFPAGAGALIGSRCAAQSLRHNDGPGSFCGAEIALQHRRNDSSAFLHNRLAKITVADDLNTVILAMLSSQRA
jgi:hypothetical protein